jgi:hypothetical protein
MSLLKSLQLAAPKPAALQRAAEREQARAELETAMKDAAKASADIADANHRKQIVDALESAAEDLKKAGAMGNQAEAEKLMKSALTRVRNAAIVKLGGTPPPEKVPEPIDKTSRTTATKAIIGAGKLGVGREVKLENEVDDGKGNKAKRTLGFGGKGWVEVQQVPYVKPERYEVTFQFAAEVKGGASAERKSAGGNERKAAVSFSGSIEVSMKHTFDTAQMQAYVAAVKAGRGSGFAELMLAAAAIQGKADDVGALVAQVKAQGGSVSALAGLKDGDEFEKTIKHQVEGEGGASGKGVGVQFGVSVSGSLTRNVKKEGGKVLIGLRSSSATSASAGAGGAANGVGMNVAGSKNAQSSEEVVFVLDEKDPKFAEHARKLMAAQTVDQMKRLRSELKGVDSYVTTTAIQGSGRNTGADVLGVGLNVFGSKQRGQSETVGPDGRTVVYSGSNTAGAALSVGGKEVASGRRTDAFVGGRDAAGKGFGQTTSTSGETDVLGSAQAFVGAVTDSPGKALGVLTGNEKFMQERVHQSGVAMSDASYERLVKLAQRSESVWIKFWAGSMATLKDWRATRVRIRNAADGDRDAVAAALADFESGSGRGRHETVRAAITGTVIPFEFPDKLASRKPMYESFVMADPVAEALGAGSDAAVLARLGDLLQQMQGLRDDLSKNLKAFGRPEDCLDMCDRLDHRVETARAELARLKKKALPKPAGGAKAPASKQSVPVSIDPQLEADAQDKRDAAVERVNALERKIGDAYRVEQDTFAQWAKDNEGDTILGFLPTHADPLKLSRHGDTLRRLYPVWDGYVKQLREALAQAGKAHDPAEADAVKPDRKRYTELYKANPKAGYRMDPEPGI